MIKNTGLKWLTTFPLFFLLFQLLSVSVLASGGGENNDKKNGQIKGTIRTADENTCLLLQPVRRNWRLGINYRF